MNIAAIYRNYYDLISRERIKDLSKIRPRIMILDVITSWIIIFFSWLIAFWHPVLWVQIMVVLVIGIKYYSLFIIGHDGLHGILFKDRKTNNLFSDIFVFAPIGAITRVNKRNHLLHHKFLSSELDPDIYKHTCTGKETILGFFFFLSGLEKVVKGLLLVMLNRHEEKKEYQNPLKHSLKEILLVIIFQLVFIVGLTYTFGWLGYIGFWVLPVYITILLDNIRSFSEHSHPEPDEDADEHRLITFLPNFFERVIFAPMNMHHHVAHHLWPSIPYYNLPKATTEMRKNVKSNELEWRKSYVNYLWKWLSNTPITQCQKEKIIKQ